MFGLFKGKDKKENLPATETKPIPGTTENAEAIEQVQEVVESIEDKSFEEIEKEQEKKLEDSEKQKQQQEKKELTEKYGITKDIPKREIEEKYVETSKKEKEDLEEEINIPELLLRMEKIDGKLEVLDNSKNESNERVTQLAEEIGELRSMIMERERSFTKMETEFETVKEAVSGLEPVRIKSAFEKRKMEILENKAKIEELETMVKAFGEEVKKFRGLLDKIKSFDNIVDLSFDMDRKITETRNVKDYIDKVAAKVEGIFSEMNSKVSELEGQREKVEKLDELTIEMTKMLDEISVKLTKFTEEKDLKEMQKTIEDNVKKMMAVKTPDKTPEMQKTIEDNVKKMLEIKIPEMQKMLESKMPVVNVKEGEGIKTEVVKTLENGVVESQNKITELSSRFTKLKSVVENQTSVINNIIEYLQGATKPTAQQAGVYQ